MKIKTRRQTEVLYIAVENESGTVRFFCLFFICFSFYFIFKLSLKYSLKLNLSRNPEILLLIIYPRVIKTYFQLKTCVQMFITELFIKAQNWKQPSVNHPAND